MSEKERKLAECCRLIEASKVGGFDGKEYPEHAGLAKGLAWLVGVNLY